MAAVPRERSRAERGRSRIEHRAVRVALGTRLQTPRLHERVVELDPLPFPGRMDQAPFEPAGVSVVLADVVQLVRKALLGEVAHAHLPVEVAVEDRGLQRPFRVERVLHRGFVRDHRRRLQRGIAERLAVAIAWRWS